MLKKKLGEILLEANAIDEYQLRSALGFQKKWGGRLGKVLVDNHFITEDTLLSALQRQTGIAAVNLKTLQIPDYVLKMIPKELAEKNHVLPIRLEGDPGKSETLIVAMSDPSNLEVLDEIQFKTGKKVKPVLAGEISLARAIRSLYFGDTDGLDLDVPATGGAGEEEMVIVQGTLEQAAMAGEAAGMAPAPVAAPPPAAPASLPADDPFAMLDALDGPAAPAPAPNLAPPPAGDPAYATMEEIEDIFSNVEASADVAPSPPAGVPAPAGTAAPDTILDAVDIELDEEISPLEEMEAAAPSPPAAPAVASPAPKPAAVPATPPPPESRPAVVPVAAARLPAQAAKPPVAPPPVHGPAQGPVPAGPRPVSEARAEGPAPAAPKGIEDLLSRVGLTAAAEPAAAKTAPAAEKPTAAARPAQSPDPWLEALLSGSPGAVEKAGGSSVLVGALLRLLIRKRMLTEKEVLEALKPKS